MATELDKLVVKIEADLSDLKKGMAQANKSVKKSSSGMSKSLGNLSKSLQKISTRAVKVGAVLGTVLAGVAIKGFVDVGIQVENLQVRLKALFGSAEEGTKAFENMVEFAGKVPFTLNQIQSAAGNLAVVADDADHLAEILAITGNVAAVTGLDFQQTAEQIQRSFSGGIASADVFREKGVRSLLGFSAGATATAEETILAFQKVFGKGGEFGNMTDELAGTLTGTVSMIKDKFFSFQLAVSESFFAELKKQFGDFNGYLEKNNQKIKEAGRAIGETLAKTVRFLVDNIDNIKLFFQVFAGVAVINALARLTLSFQTLTLAMLLNPLIMIATGLVLGGVAIYNLIQAVDDYVKSNDILTESMIKQNEVMAEAQGLLASYGKDAPRETTPFEARNIIENVDRKLALEEEEKQLKINAKTRIKTQLESSRGFAAQKISMEALVEMQKQQEEQEKNLAIIKEVTSEARGKQFDEEMEQVAKLNEKFEGIGQSISTAFGEAVVSGKDFKDSMVDIFQSVAQQVVGLIFQLQVVDPLLRSIKQSMEASQASGGGNFLSTLFKATLGSVGGSSGGHIDSGSNFAGGYGRAGGGSVNANMPYMVGERGAEMFVPKSSGNIVNNNQLGGMGKSQPIVIEQNLNFATGVSQTVRAEILNLLPAIQESTLGAVRDARLRGGSFAKDFGG